MSEAADQRLTDAEVLRMVEKKIDLLIAMARVEAEERRERRENAG
jgi:hypothetical protein